MKKIPDDLKKFIERKIGDSLSSRHRIIKLRCGIHDGWKYPNSEIADKLNLSINWVQHIKKRSFVQLESDLEQYLSGYEKTEELLKNYKTYGALLENILNSIKKEPTCSNYDIPIFSLDFNPRLKSSFKINKIKTLGDLAEKTRYELSGYKFIGERTLDKINGILKKYGLSLKKGKYEPKKSSFQAKAPKFAFPSYYKGTWKNQLLLLQNYLKGTGDIFIGVQPGNITDERSDKSPPSWKPDLGQLTNYILKKAEEKPGLLPLTKEKPLKRTVLDLRYKMYGMLDVEIYILANTVICKYIRYELWDDIPKEFMKGGEIDIKKIEKIAPFYHLPKNNHNLLTI